MQPGSMFNLNGFGIQSYFLKGILSDFEITVQADSREEYKGIIDTYTRKEFSEPVKRNLHQLLQNLLDTVYESMAKTHNLSVGAIEEMVGTSPHMGQYAVEKGFVSDLSYKDQAQSHLQAELAKKWLLKKSDPKELKESDPKESPDHPKQEIQKEIKQEIQVVALKSYVNQMPDSTSKDKIGIIVLDGDVSVPGHTYNSSYDTFSVDNLDKAFASVLKDKKIKAVVFRINSRGGAASGAEVIWHAVKRTVDAGIPVVVSMGGTAASAGYYIAAPASEIYALPTTITGSIGVAFAKPNVRKISEKYGINWDMIEVGKGARIWSLLDDFDPEVWERIKKTTDYTYQFFMNKVVEGRQMNQETVHSIAKGQVWSGLQAKEYKLIDKLGGFCDALESAKTLGNVKEKAPQLIVLNRQPFTLFNLLSMLEMETTERVKAKLITLLPKAGMDFSFSATIQ
jgi:protease-4